MRAVGLKTLKNKLSEYVRMVAAGDTVLITDRERVVAELVPPRETGSLLLSHALAGAVQKGWITPAVAGRSSAPSQPALGAPRNPPATERGGSRRPLIYLDSSVALAQLLGGDMRLPPRLWGEDLVSSRLLEYEFWTRANAVGPKG
jgi:prevent-host-death family protein